MVQPFLRPGAAKRRSFVEDGEGCVRMELVVCLGDGKAVNAFAMLSAAAISDTKWSEVAFTGTNYHQIKALAASTSRPAQLIQHDMDQKRTTQPPIIPSICAVRRRATPVIRSN
jgi:hypothetical protein